MASFSSWEPCSSHGKLQNSCIISFFLLSARGSACSRGSSCFREVPRAAECVTLFSSAVLSSPSVGSHAFRCKVMPSTSVPSFAVFPCKNSTYTHIHTCRLPFLLLHGVADSSHTAVHLAITVHEIPLWDLSTLTPWTSLLLGIPEWGALGFIYLLTEVSLVSNC